MDNQRCKVHDSISFKAQQSGFLLSYNNKILCSQAFVKVILVPFQLVFKVYAPIDPVDENLPSPASKKIYNFVASNSKPTNGCACATQAKYPHLAKQTIATVQQYGGVTTRLIHHQNSVDKPTYKVSLLKEARKALAINEIAKYSVRCKLVVGLAGLS